MHRPVADLADQRQLGRDALPDDALEAGVGDPRRQVRLVWLPQTRHVVEVADQEFRDPAGVDAGGAWIGDEVRLGAGAVVGYRGERLADEVEVAHVPNPGMTVSTR